MKQKDGEETGVINPPLLASAPDPVLRSRPRVALSPGQAEEYYTAQILIHQIQVTYSSEEQISGRVVTQNYLQGQILHL